MALRFEYGGVSMSTWIFKGVVGAVVVLTTASVQAQGRIYRWVDAKGTVCFSQTPPEDHQSRTLTLLPATALPGAETTQAGKTAIKDIHQSLRLPPTVALTEEIPSEQSLAGEDWDDALLNRAVLNRANLNTASFQGASLIEATFQGAKMQQVVLREANLQGANLTMADLRGAVINDANLSEIKATGARLQGASVDSANLSHADFRDADLRGLTLQYVSLVAANLQGANLQGAVLVGANLKNTDLDGADLRGADLSQVAELTREQLSTAYLDENTQLPAFFEASPAEVPSQWTVRGNVSF